VSEQALRFNTLLTDNSKPATQLEEMVLSKLVRVLGKEKTASLLDETMTALQLTEIATVQELLLVSNAFIKKGGFPSVVGRSFKVFAILRGATE
jgi:hypothetical protein